MMTLEQIRYERARLEMDIERQVREFVDAVHDTGVLVCEVNVEMIDVSTMTETKYNQVKNVEVKLGLI